MTQLPRASPRRQLTCDRGFFKARQRRAAEAKILTVRFGSPTSKACATGSKRQSVPHRGHLIILSNAITRCVSSSSVYLNDKISRGCRSSCRQAANDEVKTNLWLAALQEDRRRHRPALLVIKPLPTGRSKISVNSKTLCCRYFGQSEWPRFLVSNPPR